MARRATNWTDSRRLTVQVHDRVRGESISLTVYGADLADVARACQDRLRRSWSTTLLADRRHKRRY